MRKLRLLLAAGFVAVLVSACSNPVASPYPSPDDPKDPPPPPEPGLVLSHPGR